ncbi:hypothetical protein MPOCJGCO_1727 [Methylobacterium trifolii]|uniref:Uncharacterized protein n=1 Tax=Methylobacterium trifolii TaxID=1003092 RepID=A0ABQ4U1A7_9HYPH|nr:hypothetical protein MPOCJGCO_1727 [Methylobacterium trifolii]
MGAPPVDGAGRQPRLLLRHRRADPGAAAGAHHLLAARRPDLGRLRPDPAAGAPRGRGPGLRRDLRLRLCPRLERAGTGGRQRPRRCALHRAGPAAHADSGRPDRADVPGRRPLGDAARTRTVALAPLPPRPPGRGGGLARPRAAGRRSGKTRRLGRAECRRLRRPCPRPSPWRARHDRDRPRHDPRPRPFARAGLRPDGPGPPAARDRRADLLRADRGGRIDRERARLAAPGRVQDLPAAPAAPAGGHRPRHPGGF